MHYVLLRQIPPNAGIPYKFILNTFVCLNTENNSGVVVTVIPIHHVISYKIRIHLTALYLDNSCSVRPTGIKKGDHCSHMHNKSN